MTRLRAWRARSVTKSKAELGGYHDCLWIKEIDSKSASWITAGALRELESEEVKKMSRR